MQKNKGKWKKIAKMIYLKVAEAEEQTLPLLYTL